MTEEHFHKTAKSFIKSAERVEDGINNVLEPGVKEARISADDSRRVMEALARRVTVLFSLSILFNVLMVLYLLFLA